MSLQFIFGNSGSGKSHCLYQNIIEQSIRHPEKNYLVLVPEQFTMQTQKDLCLMHPRGGIMNIDVLSFGRLAHRVFEEVGQDNRTVLDDEGKNLILRKIAGDYGFQEALGDPLVVFGSMPIYAPWKVFVWQGVAPEIMDGAVTLGCVWFILPLLFFILCLYALRPRGNESLHGTARWAVKDEIEKMGYLSGAGVYVGGWREKSLLGDRLRYLRHNGPEHILCFAPTYGYMACAWASLLSNLLMMLLSYFIGQRRYPIPYDLRTAAFYTGLAAALYAAGMLPEIQSEWLRLGYRTLLLLAFLAVIIWRDVPLKSLLKRGK